MLQHLTIVATGGTIDKIYFDDKSTYQIGAPQIGEILGKLGVAFTFDVIALMRKDSLHMDGSPRNRTGMSWSRTAPTPWSKARACWPIFPAKSSC